MDDDDLTEDLRTPLCRPRVLHVYAQLRDELAPVLRPELLSRVLTRAARSTDAHDPDDVLREMRASIAGQLLDVVSDFLVRTHVDVEDEGRQTQPSRPIARLARVR